MIRRRLAAASIALLLTSAPLLAAAQSACPPAPIDTDGDIAPLRHIVTSLKAGTTLEVLAVGSATVFNPATGAAADAANKAAGAAPPPPTQTGFPWQAAHSLEATIRGLHVNVTVIGKRGLSAVAMLDLLRAELPHKPYRLVLWQSGTVEAVQESPPDEYYQALADGAAAVTAAGADLVLIDPQYSRFLAANANLEPYQSALQAAAALPGVGLFHRFDLMRTWAASGIIDLERAPKAERQATAARLHACLGRELARELVGAGG